jgi:DNA-binding NarL/FixJ family response regulator
MPIRVLIADDHTVVRQALRLLLEREGFEVVAEATDGHQAIRAVRESEPDVAVLDLVMPLLNGVETAREIRQASPRTRTILLTSRSDDERILEALKAGIRGCALKSCDAQELIRAIREVAAGGTYMSPEVSTAVVSACIGAGSESRDRLTSRERQVLQLIAEGKKTREIAELLGVSIKTAESHRGRLMRKLLIRDTAGLVRYAIRRGLSEL